MDDQKIHDSKSKLESQEVGARRVAQYGPADAWLQAWAHTLGFR